MLFIKVTLWPKFQTIKTQFCNTAKDPGLIRMHSSWKLPSNRYQIEQKIHKPNHCFSNISMEPSVYRISVKNLLSTWFLNGLLIPLSSEPPFFTQYLALANALWILIRWWILTCDWTGYNYSNIIKKLNYFIWLATIYHSSLMTFITLVCHFTP